MPAKAIEHFVQDHIPNEEVHRMTQAAIGEYNELLTLVMKRKLRSFWQSRKAFHFSSDNVTGLSERRYSEEEVERQIEKVDRN